jgi:hypothetical protein
VRTVGLAALAIAFWADVVLLRLVLTHHCTPEELADEIVAERPAQAVAPDPAPARVGPPASKRERGYECALPLDVEDDVRSHHHVRGFAPDNPLSTSAIVAGMNGIRPAIHDCYVVHAVPGTAMVNVVIGKSGRVTSAVVNGKFAGTPTGACVEHAVTTARFPRSDGFATPYPFQLK